MKKILFKIRGLFIWIEGLFEVYDEPPRGEYPEEDRKKEFCVKANYCSLYGTKKCPLMS